MGNIFNDYKYFIMWIDHNLISHFTLLDIQIVSITSINSSDGKHFT